jgi:hypothetical protein
MTAIADGDQRIKVVRRRVRVFRGRRYDSDREIGAWRNGVVKEGRKGERTKRSNGTERVVCKGQFS